MSERLHPYAIVPAEASAAPSPEMGMRGAPVVLERAGRLGTWLSALAPFTADQADLLSHHRVVESICARGPALPVRFGSSFQDAAALRGALEAKEDALLAALARVGTRRELAITLAWRQTAGEHAEVLSPDAGPGRRFMAERARRWAATEVRRRRATELESALRAMLTTAGVRGESVKTRIVPSPRVALSCAVLIEPAHAADVLRRVSDGGAGWADVTTHTAGPWPAYTFADLSHGE